MLCNKRNAKMGWRTNGNLLTTPLRRRWFENHIHIHEHQASQRKESNRIQKNDWLMHAHLIPRMQLGVFRLRAHACRSRECLTSLFLFFPFCSRLFFFVRSGYIHVLRLADQKPETFRRSWCVYPTLCLDFVRFWDTCLCWPLRPTIRYSFTPVYSRLEELDTHYLHGHVPLVEVNTKLLCLSPLPRSAVSSLSVLSFLFRSRAFKRIYLYPTPHQHSDSGIAG